MQIVDIVIILMLALGAVVGFARGFLRQTVKSLGGILVMVFSFIFMGPLSILLMNTFPTFNFSGMFNGISSLNILVYQIIAFIILLAIFSIILRIVLILATSIEKFLNATIILAIPSKILGAILGLVEAYLIVFIVIFILTLPIFNIDIINNSKYKDNILEGTPIVSALAKKMVNSFDEIYALKDELSKDANRMQLDHKVLQILIDNKIVSEDRATELYKNGKLKTK